MSQLPKCPSVAYPEAGFKRRPTDTGSALLPGMVISVWANSRPRWPLQIPPPLAGSNSPRQDRPIVGQSAAARSVFDASCLTSPVSRLAASFSR
jgi:hypothetical protein